MKFSCFPLAKIKVRMPKGKGRQKEPDLSLKPIVHLSKPTRRSNDSEASSSSTSENEIEEIPSKKSGRRQLKAHRIRFIDYKPSYIMSLALTPRSFRVDSMYEFASSDREMLAVGKSDGSVHIYVYIGGGDNVSSNSARKLRKKLLKTGNKQTWILFTILPGIINAGAAGRLVWTHHASLTEDELELFDEGDERTNALFKLQATPPRLFSINGTCDIFEWQWFMPAHSASASTSTESRLGDVKRKLSITNESVSIYDLVSNPSGTRLAAACSNGAIHLIDILDDAFLPYKTLDISSPASLLSLAYGPPLSRGEDSYIIAGCSNSAIRKWDARSGRCIAKLTLDKATSKQATLVWAVATLLVTLFRL